jgi:hypothetical protein
MGIMQQLGARATLLTVNMITLIFSCILIFYGTTGIGALLRERLRFLAAAWPRRTVLKGRLMPAKNRLRRCPIRIYHALACMLFRLLQPRTRVRVVRLAFCMAGMCKCTSRQPRAEALHAMPPPGFIKMGREKTIGHVTNAFALVISMGAIMLLVSLLGLIGACCSRFRF